MKRLVKILKWVAIATGTAIAVLLLLNAYYVWSTGTRLERRLSALRAAGQPVQLADLTHPPIPPESNADVYFHRALGDLEAMDKEITVRDPTMASMSEPLSATDQQRLESLFNAYPKAIPLLEQAAGCPDDDPQYDVTLPTQKFLGPVMERDRTRRSVYRVLRARSALLIAQKRYDDALASQVVALRLARRWMREPLIMGYLVTAVCEYMALDGVNHVLQAGPVSPEARRALDAELALHDNMEGYAWALQSERAFSLTAFREMPMATFWLTRAPMNTAMLSTIDLYDQFLGEATQPYAAVAVRKGPRTQVGWNPYKALAVLLEPGLDACRQPAERTRAMSRCLRILNALQTRAPAGSDAVPKLDELGLPAAATIDPFSGNPLIVKKQPQGWLVYSVGQNLNDDGGKFVRNTDIGVGPIQREDPSKRP